MPGEDADDRPAGEVAAAMRALLTAIDEGQMSCSRGYRSRLQGAVMTLETQTGKTRPPEPGPSKPPSIQP